MCSVFRGRDNEMCEHELGMGTDESRNPVIFSHTKSTSRKLGLKKDFEFFINPLSFSLLVCGRFSLGM